jgi:hypothetical protein
MLPRLLMCGCAGLHPFVMSLMTSILFVLFFVRGFYLVLLSNVDAGPMQVKVQDTLVHRWLFFDTTSGNNLNLGMIGLQVCSLFFVFAIRAASFP